MLEGTGLECVMSDAKLRLGLDVFGLANRVTHKC